MPNPAATPTAAVLTLGCKLNIADSEAMARRLRLAGWRVVDRAGPDADAVIINSCSVTHVADQKSRHLARLARRLAPDATIAFTGCLVETADATALEALGAGLVYRQVDQATLAGRLIELHPTSKQALKAGQTKTVRGEPETVRGEPVEPRVIHKTPATEAAGPLSLKTRAFVAAQEGCNDVCAFCIIPRTRGRERSKTVAAVVAEALQWQAEGARELVITGTQLGAYGRDRGERELASLLRALLSETSFPRIRISSVQPQDLTPELIGLWQDERLCRHFHLALQSGSDPVLRRMRRRYSAAEYAAAVTSIRAAIAGVAITTDVIAGFPGETDVEFEETLAFCREMAFAAMHVFPYSTRKGTSAEKLPGQVAKPVKKERVHRLIALGDELTSAFRRRFVGASAGVLWESRREDGAWEGLTDTYLRVRLHTSDNLYNRITLVRLSGLTDEGLVGEVIP